MARIFFAVLAIGVCLLLMQSAARIGCSRLFSRYAVSANSLPAADQAIRLTPDDPDAYRSRAIVLNRLRQPADAEASLERAATLRPGHASLWLALANTRDELGDSEGALAAFNEAVRAAPYYGQPHWQRGNLLVRMGRYDEAFADLRQAAASDRRLLPNLIDLAWGLTGGDAKRTAALTECSSDHDRLEFARFLARKARGPEVVEQLRLLNTPLSEENKTELIRLLIAARKFRDALGLYKGSGATPEIVNPGFEEPLAFKNVSFGWVVTQQPNAKFAVDVAEKFAGAKSLQVSFNGESNPSLLWQTIVLDQGRYRITFAAKTKDLVTGAQLRMVVTNPANNQVLGTSEAFPPAGESWQVVGVEFTIPPDTEAVQIGLARDACAATPCPIFGILWLDEFAVRKM